MASSKVLCMVPALLILFCVQSIIGAESSEWKKLYPLTLMTQESDRLTVEANGDVFWGCEWSQGTARTCLGNINKENPLPGCIYTQALTDDQKKQASILIKMQLIGSESKPLGAAQKVKILRIVHNAE